MVGTGDYLPDQSFKIQRIQGGFSEIPLAKIFFKFLRFGTNENVKITVDVLENLRLADLVALSDDKNRMLKGIDMIILFLKSKNQMVLCKFCFRKQGRMTLVIASAMIYFTKERVRQG